MMIDIDIAQQLFPNPSTMIIQLLATGVLFYFVFRFLWEPARALMAKRSNFVHEKLSEAEEKLAEAKEKNKSAHEEVSKAVFRSQEIISKAEKEALASREEILEQAKKDATSKLEKARDEIAIERSQMRDEMVEEMVTVAMLAAEKLISEKVDSDSDQKTIEKFVKELNKQNESIS
ncbi:MAG: F0F1 ATP synthase subunit B [Anaerorhabdus sp.]|uniref:F0F1 ATP synthase subunit B n=1 Tax=Anaerorhabdus sp. TaxID=1872524 RepID=UPI003A8488F2